MLTCLNIDNDLLLTPFWMLIVALIGSISYLCSALIFFRKPVEGKFLAALGLACSFIVLVPFMADRPIIALLGSIGTISSSLLLIHFKVKTESIFEIKDVDICRQRLQGSIYAILAIILLAIFIDKINVIFFSGTFVASVLIGQILLIHYVLLKYLSHIRIILVILSVLISILLIISMQTEYPFIIAFINSLLVIFFLQHSKPSSMFSDYWLVTLLNNPARILLATFLGLCIVGTLLLLTPAATNNSIATIDAAFTAVSAVCVTGLIVLDTPNDYTFWGQLFILLLIQLGGLGIMSIASIALFILGKKLSVLQENLLTSITNVERKDMFESLKIILKFTFIAEAIGSIILTLLYFTSGDSFLQALWRGVFTSISAFCNAGFALQTDSLIPYQNNPFILHTVALLIIFGGIAPAISILLPGWVLRKHVPVTAHISFLTTVILLFLGALLLLAFEWNGVLADFSFVDKLNNAWFQSATLRTAGFNSVDISRIGDPSCLLMVCLMFIGGSPGGTAGGVKTTTITILFITFLTYVFNRNDIIVKNRRITSDTINQAITIVFSGFIFWIIIIIMLELTQQILSRDIIFEATSAIGTVGLSTGATMKLDEIGKIIIMIAMFVGRLGPITLFILLSEGKSTSISRYPEAKVILT